MDVWTLLIVGLALWFGYQWGKHHGRDKDDQARALWEAAQREEDPEKKTKLLLAWYGIVGRGSGKASLRERIAGIRKKERRR